VLKDFKATSGGFHARRKVELHEKLKNILTQLYPPGDSVNEVLLCECSSATQPTDLRDLALLFLKSEHCPRGSSQESFGFLKTWGDASLRQLAAETMFLGLRFFSGISCLLKRHSLARDVEKEALAAKQHKEQLMQEE
jgi:hypothetical protein